MLYDDGHLLGDVEGVELDPAHEPLEGGAALHLPLVHLLAVMSQFEGQAVGGVVLQDIEDEPFLDGLAHGVHVEGRRHVVRGRLPGRVRAGAEQFECLALGRGGEGHEGDAAVLGRARGHLGGQDVLAAHLTAVLELCQLVGRQQFLQLGCRLAGLRTVGFVRNHREPFAELPRLLTKDLERWREGLDGTYDDLLLV